jgi:hypothetical protein
MVINESGITEDLEESCCGLIKNLSRILPDETGENHVKTKDS